jgi:hypothetical protein
LHADFWAKFFKCREEYYQEASVIPIAFQKFGKDLLVHSKLIMKKNKIATSST